MKIKIIFDFLPNYFFSKKYLAFLFPFLRELYYWSRRILSRSFNNIIIDHKSNTNTAYKHEDSKLLILFVTGYGIGTHYRVVEPPLIRALKNRGHSVISLFCGKAFDCCEFNADCGSASASTPFSHRRGISKMARLRYGNACVNNVVTEYTKLGFESVNLSNIGRHSFIGEEDNIAKELLSSGEDLRKITYKGIAIGEEAFASILRVTFAGEISDRFNNSSLVVKYLANSIVPLNTI